MGLLIKMKRGHTEDFFADFIISIPIIVIGIIILSFYTGAHDVDEINQNVDDVLEREKVFINFLKSPIRDELINSFNEKDVLNKEDSFKNMDIADAIILKPYIEKKYGIKEWESLVDYSILDKYILKDLGRGYDFKVRYPDGSKFSKQDLDLDDDSTKVDFPYGPPVSEESLESKTYIGSGNIVYLPGLDGKRIEVELIII